jgi:hypothetical protein
MDESISANTVINMQQMPIRNTSKTRQEEKARMSNRGESSSATRKVIGNEELAAEHMHIQNALSSSQTFNLKRQMVKQPQGRQTN